MTAVYAATIRNRPTGSPSCSRAAGTDGAAPPRPRAAQQVPLAVATQYNYVEAVRLRTAPAAGRTMNNGEAAINLAAKFGHWEMVLLARSRRTS